jgi:hypothetical protein
LLFFLSSEATVKLLGLLLFAIVLALLLIEGVLRWTIGLGKPPLYQGDPEIGYLLAPNQTTRRMGNQISINQFSMRSDPITVKRPDGVVRVFLIGDSLVNGAWWTDQSATLSALMQKQISQSLGQSVEVLNASANSWGPRNQLAYLKRFGLFESQVLVLLINTDDLFATAPTALPVGRDRNYPNKLPSTAISELLSNQLTRPQPIPGMAEVMAEPGDRVGNNLAAIEAINAIARQGNARFILGFTPLKREADGTQMRDYEKKARQRLQDWAKQQNILLIDFLPFFQEHTRDLYRDHIHLSPQGNQQVSQSLSDAVLQQLTQEQL